ncbi:MAG: flagellar hook-length control protein FliK [Steroidobacterales bacterium]
MEQQNPAAGVTAPSAGLAGRIGSPKGAGRRATANAVADSANPLGSQAIWLPTPMLPPGATAALAGDAQDSDGQDSESTRDDAGIEAVGVGGLVNAATAQGARAAPSSLALASEAAQLAAAAPASAATAAAQAGSDAEAATAAPAATMASVGHGTLAAAPAALASAAAAASVTAAAASTDDHAHAFSAASSADLSALTSLARALPEAVGQAGAADQTISVAVSDSAWPRAVAAQVQLLAAANVQSATLRLSPEHLGPMEVRIDLQSSQINVSFVAAHAETRSALEQSVPTLRAMLASGGLTLGQAQVHPEARSASQPFANNLHGSADAVTDEEPISIGVVRSAGLIDEYA